MVVIVGAGIVGAATAYYLSNNLVGAGSCITILDAVGPASGSSGKAGAFVTNSPPLRRGMNADKRQPLFKASFELHEELAKDLKLQSFCRVHNYQAVQRADKSNNSGATNTGRRHQEESNYDCNTPSWLTELGEQYDCQSLEGDAALVDPAELTNAMLNKALSRNNCSLRQATVSGIELDSSGRNVVEIYFESDSRVEKRKRLQIGENEPVVFALGAWSCRLEDWIGVPTPIEGIVSTSLVYQEGVPAADIGTALFFDDDLNGCHLEVFGRKDKSLYVSGCGESQVIGTEVLRSGARPSPKGSPPDIARAAAAENSLKEVGFGRSQADVIQACVRPMSPDGVPIVGNVFGNVYIATGGGPWGITWGPLMGKTLSALISDEEGPPIRLGSLKPQRFDTLIYQQLLKSRAPVSS